jgi:hypothetical protein
MRLVVVRDLWMDDTGVNCIGPGYNNWIQGDIISVAMCDLRISSIEAGRAIISIQI